MVGMGTSIQHGGNAIDYAINKEKSEIIEKQLIVGSSGNEIKNEFKMFQDLNKRAINNDLSFVLSPDPKDGKLLSNEDFKKIARDFLKKMNLEKNQAIVIKHSDKKHTHLHLFVNRIDSNGKAYNDSFIGTKSQQVAHEIAKEKGLVSAKEVKRENELERDNKNKEVKQKIKEYHKKIMKQRPKNFQEYSKMMNKEGVQIKPTINKQKVMQGYRIELKGSNLKASEVDRSMTLSKLNPKFKQNEKSKSIGYGY